MPSLQLRLPPAIPGASVRRLVTKVEGRKVQDIRFDPKTTFAEVKYIRGIEVTLSDSGVLVHRAEVRSNKAPYIVPPRPCDCPPEPEPIPEPIPEPRKTPNLASRLAAIRAKLGNTGVPKDSEDASTSSASSHSPESSEIESETKSSDSSNTLETSESAEKPDEN